MLNTSVQLVTFGTFADEAVDDGVPVRVGGAPVLELEATVVDAPEGGGLAACGLTPGGGLTAPAAGGGGRADAAVGVPTLAGLASGGAVGWRFGRACGSA